MKVDIKSKTYNKTYQLADNDEENFIKYVDQYFDSITLNLINKNGNKVIEKINFNDIYLIECSEGYLYFYFFNETKKMRGKLIDFMNIYNGFIQIGKGKIVNINHIQSLHPVKFSTTFEIILTNQLKIGVSRKYINLLKGKI